MSMKTRVRIQTVIKTNELSDSKIDEAVNELNGIIGANASRKPGHILVLYDELMTWEYMSMVKSIAQSYTGTTEGTFDRMAVSFSPSFDQLDERSLGVFASDIPINKTDIRVAIIPTEGLIKESFNARGAIDVDPNEAYNNQDKREYYLNRYAMSSCCMVYLTLIKMNAERTLATFRVHLNILSFGTVKERRHHRTEELVFNYEYNVKPNMQILSQVQNRLDIGGRKYSKDLENVVDYAARNLIAQVGEAYKDQEVPVIQEVLSTIESSITEINVVSTKLVTAATAIGLAFKNRAKLISLYPNLLYEEELKSPNWVTPSRKNTYKRAAPTYKAVAQINRRDEVIHGIPSQYSDLLREYITLSIAYEECIPIENVCPVKILEILRDDAFEIPNFRPNFPNRGNANPNQQNGGQSKKKKKHKNRSLPNVPRLTESERKDQEAQIDSAFEKTNSSAQNSIVSNEVNPQVFPIRTAPYPVMQTKPIPVTDRAQDQNFELSLPIIRERPIIPGSSAQIPPPLLTEDDYSSDYDDYAESPEEPIE